MRKNIVAALVGVGLAAAVVPQPARAFPTNTPVTACSTSALQVCAAVSAESKLVGSTYHLVLKLWNLFGYSASSGVSHAITYVGIGSDQFTGSASAVSAKFNGSAVTTWTNVKKKNINNNDVGVELDMAAVGGGNGKVVGCGLGSPPGAPYGTCFGGTQTPYLELDFTLSGEFNLGDPTTVYGWHSQDVGGTGCSLWADSNGNTVADAGTGCSSNVVPEPVTMVLLGTGLASMGGLGLVRRRKRNGDIEST